MEKRIINNNCDGQGSGNCAGEHSEVRRLPTGEDSAIIVCFNHYQREIAWRKERNRELTPSSRFEIPSWQSLKVYPEE